jgi:hypothetical protein
LGDVRAADLHPLAPPDTSSPRADIIKEAGTGFAFPSQTAYFTEDTGLDTEQSSKAVAQVKDWRVKGKLPFNEFENKKSL